MSVETEFQSTIENVQNAYKGLANLGATIPQNKNIENISDCLDEIYGVLPKTSFQEGTEVTIEGGLKGKIDFDTDNGKKVVGKGDTEQESTTGKNLWNITDYTTSTDIMPNQSATITKQLNGFKIHTAELTNSGVYIRNVNNHIQGFTADTTYYLSFDCTSSKSVSRFVYGQSSVIGTLTAGETKRFIVDVRNKSPFVFYVNEELDLTIENIMICATNDSNFEPYTGGYASPSPNWEQPIQCVTGNQSIVESDGNNNSITYPISLGNIELCKIGDYADELLYDVDEDRVYKNEKIGKVVLNGSENWAINKDKTYTFQFLINSLISRANGSTSLMNMFYYKYGDPTDTTNENYFWIYNNQSLAIVIQKTIVSTLAEFKTWLGTNKPKLYYVLATATEIEITDTTLINQVKALYNSQSYNGTTIIESNGDLPMIIKVRALKGE